MHEERLVWDKEMLDRMGFLTEWPLHSFLGRSQKRHFKIRNEAQKMACSNCSSDEPRESFESAYKDMKYSKNRWD